MIPPPASRCDPIATGIIPACLDVSLRQPAWQTIARPEHASVMLANADHRLLPRFLVVTDRRSSTCWAIILTRPISWAFFTSRFAARMALHFAPQSPSGWSRGRPQMQYFIADPRWREVAGGASGHRVGTSRRAGPFAQMAGRSRRVDSCGRLGYGRAGRSCSRLTRE